MMKKLRVFLTNLHNHILHLIWICSRKQFVSFEYKNLESKETIFTVVPDWILFGRGKKQCTNALVIVRNISKSPLVFIAESTYHGSWSLYALFHEHIEALYAVDPIRFRTKYSELWRRIYRKCREEFPDMKELFKSIRQPSSRSELAVSILVLDFARQKLNQSEFSMYQRFLNVRYARLTSRA